MVTVGDPDSDAARIFVGWVELKRNPTQTGKTGMILLGFVPQPNLVYKGNGG